GSDFLSYILALASPVRGLPDSAYVSGLGVNRQLKDATYALELAHNKSFSVKVQNGPETRMVPSYSESEYRCDTSLYGLPIAVGSIDTTLLEAYQPFLAFDPRGKRDQFADYFDNHIRLTQAYQRRDNEMGY